MMQLQNQVARRIAALRRLTLRQLFNTTLNTIETRLQLPAPLSLPQHVDIVLTNACNLACVFCQNNRQDDATPGTRGVSRGNFERVARQLFPTARWVGFCSGGEPYVHQGLEDLLRIARRYRVSTWVLSNGMLLNEERIRTIVREGLVTLHGFSVDGIKAATVETLRVHAKLEVIQENIRRLMRIREEEGKREPRVVIRYVLMLANVEELPEAVRYWGESGIDRIDCTYLSVCNDVDPRQSLFFHQNLMERFYRKAWQAVARYPRMKLNLPRPVREEQPLLDHPVRCTAPWDFVHIEADGRVLPCHGMWEPFSMGNVYAAQGPSFRQIWRSPYYRALRRTVNRDDAEKFHPDCAYCATRFGWGDLTSHLGGQVSQKLLGDQPGTIPSIPRLRKVQ